MYVQTAFPMRSPKGTLYRAISVGMPRVGSVGHENGEYWVMAQQLSAPSDGVMFEITGDEWDTFTPIIPPNPSLADRVAASYLESK